MISWFPSFLPVGEREKRANSRGFQDNDHPYFIINIFLYPPKCLIQCKALMKHCLTSYSQTKWSQLQVGWCLLLIEAESRAALTNFIINKNPKILRREFRCKKLIQKHHLQKFAGYLFQNLVYLYTLFLYFEKKKNSNCHIYFFNNVAPHC